MSMPIGIIAIWSGSIGSIPAGWQLCDGAAGTPDLRDRFVIGAGGGHAPDDIGGSTTHTHTFTGDGHAHTFPAGALLGAGAAFSSTTTSNVSVGTTDTTNHEPPFYALAYIQRIS